MAGFITPRDLFRWAGRQPGTYQELAQCGYMLLGERLRQPAEQVVVREVLQKLLPHVSVQPEAMYASMHREHLVRTQGEAAAAAAAAEGIVAAQGAVWIASTVRLHSLVGACMRHDEPVLLVGETGTGKTTVCQLYADAVGQRLHIINCHQHTETADFLGGLRPARGRTLKVRQLAERLAAFEADVRAAVGSAVATGGGVSSGGAAGTAARESAEAMDVEGEADANADADADAVPSVDVLQERLEAAAALVHEGAVTSASGGPRAADDAAEAAKAAAGALHAEASALRQLAVACNALFVWEDGPLLTAMRQGDLLLIDEISLAEDAVRANWTRSTLMIAEEGIDDGWYRLAAAAPLLPRRCCRAAPLLLLPGPALL